MDQPSSLLWRPARQGIPTLLAAGLLLLNGGCGLIRPRGTGLTPPMPVASPLRKQVLQGFMPFGSIAWVNDEQVVFHGVPVGSQQETALYLWDLKRQPRLLLEKSRNSCVSHGVIRTYQLLSGGQARPFFISGPDFNLRPRANEQAPGLSAFDPVTCSWIATPAPLRGRIWEPLRRGQGFLDFGPRDLSPTIRRVEHLEADGITRHDTGIRMEPPMLPQAVYGSHDGSSLIYDLNQTPAQLQHWLRTGRRTIWRLDRQLRGEPLVIPAGPWVNPVGGTLSFLSARPGLLLRSNNFGRNRTLGGAGLYLLAPRAAIQRLERGLAEDAAVSPNGCRVAYSFQPWLSAPIAEGGPRLVVLDLCRTPPMRNATST